MEEKARILVVEDDERIRQMLRLFLEREGFFVAEAENGVEALAKVREENFDLLILDIMMPEMDGWETCRRVKEIKDIPIIMLTARGEEMDRILGFELGADDYVVKPFSPVELVLRVKALLRRVRPRNGEKRDGVLTFPHLTIDPQARRVKAGEKEIHLTPMEFDLLYFLATNEGRVFTREQLLDKVWGYDYYGELRTVDTHIKRLREKLGKGSPQAAEYLITVWGVGYKFGVEK